LTCSDKQPDSEASRAFRWQSNCGIVDAHGNSEADGLPDISDLTPSLQFSPSEGRIWLDTQPLALFHQSTLSSMLRELIDKLRMQDACGLITRMGYASGSRDADIAKKLRPNQSLQDTFLAWPQLRAIQGSAAIQPVFVEVNIDTGHFYAEARFSGSFEVNAQLAEYGMASGGVCWMQTGYASGFASTFMGSPALFKEVECQASGHRNCRMIGKSLTMWDADEIEDELSAYPTSWYKHIIPIKPRTKHPKSAGTILAQKNIADMPKNMIGASSSFVSTCGMLHKVAGTRATVLFLGETGVGKEIFAQTLHQLSNRKDRAFIPINCAAIPDGLIEAELFGVEKGAFTGATESRQGRFERAHGGTLFLDEVDTLTLEAQVKLLRAIQENEIERVGDTTTRKVDVRLIAATNMDLQAAVKNNTFRADLLYRLNIFPIQIPPLRERREDIPLLMQHFLHNYARLYGKRINEFTENAADALYRYDYPGNIRELENMIERAVILAGDDQLIQTIHLFASESLSQFVPSKSAKKTGPGNPATVDKTVYSTILDEMISRQASLKSVEEELMKKTLLGADGNMVKAAKALGLSRAQLAYRSRNIQENK
jgi:DNA-binding NtrC family response regulator